METFQQLLKRISLLTLVIILLQGCVAQQKASMNKYQLFSYKFFQKNADQFTIYLHDRKDSSCQLMNANITDQNITGEKANVFATSTLQNPPLFTKELHIFLREGTTISSLSEKGHGTNILTITPSEISDVKTNKNYANRRRNTKILLYGGLTLGSLLLSLFPYLLAL